MTMPTSPSSAPSGIWRARRRARSRACRSSGCLEPGWRASSSPALPQAARAGAQPCPGRGRVSRAGSTVARGPSLPPAAPSPLGPLPDRPPAISARGGRPVRPERQSHLAGAGRSPRTVRPTTSSASPRPTLPGRRLIFPASASCARSLDGALGQPSPARSTLGARRRSREPGPPMPRPPGALLLPRPRGAPGAGRPRACPRRAHPAFDVARGAARLPDPGRARQRPAAGLARQRRDHAEAAGGDRPPRVLLRARELQHPPRRARAGGARDRRLRGRAREGARASSTRRRASEIVFVRGATEAHQPGRAELGPAATSARATRSSSPTSSTTPTSCPGSSSAPRRARKLRVAPVDDRGQVLLDEYEKLLGPQTQARRVHAGVERARHDHAGAARWSRWRTATARACWSTARRRSRTCASTCRRSTADFFVFSGHKVFAPDRHRRASTASTSVLEAMPPWQGGGNMIADVTFEKTRLPARRRRASRPAPATSPTRSGLGAALDYVERIGIENIARLRARAAGVRDAAAARRSRACGSIGTAREKASVLSFVLDGLRDRGGRRGARPEGIAVRAGPPLRAADPAPLRRSRPRCGRRSRFYNTCEDIDALVAALHRLANARRPH